MIIKPNFHRILCDYCFYRETSDQNAEVKCSQGEDVEQVRGRSRERSTA